MHYGLLAGGPAVQRYHEIKFGLVFSCAQYTELQMHVKRLTYMVQFGLTLSFNSGHISTNLSSF